MRQRKLFEDVAAVAYGLDNKPYLDTYLFHQTLARRSRVLSYVTNISEFMALVGTSSKIRVGTEEYNLQA